MLGCFASWFSSVIKLDTRNSLHTLFCLLTMLLHSLLLGYLVQSLLVLTFNSDFSCFNSLGCLPFGSLQLSIWMLGTASTPCIGTLYCCCNPQWLVIHFQSLLCCFPVQFSCLSTFFVFSQITSSFGHKCLVSSQIKLFCYRNGLLLSKMATIWPNLPCLWRRPCPVVVLRSIDRKSVV